MCRAFRSQYAYLLSCECRFHNPYALIHNLSDRCCCELLTLLLNLFAAPSNTMKSKWTILDVLVDRRIIWKWNAVFTRTFEKHCVVENRLELQSSCCPLFWEVTTNIHIMEISHSYTLNTVTISVTALSSTQSMFGSFSTIQLVMVRSTNKQKTGNSNFQCSVFRCTHA